MERLPSLNAIRSFVAAARAQSFTLAANELHVTQGAVSRMVQALEDDLGIQLFNRNGRTLSLTSAGQEYYQEVSLAMARIEDATRNLRSQRTQQALKLVVNSSFAIRWLMPRLPDFHQQFPDIEVHILGDTDSSHSEQADLVIRYGKGDWPGVQVEPLPLGRLMGAVCSPAFKASRQLHSPADLLTCPLLTHTASSGFWAEYFAHFQLPAPDMGVAPRFYQLMLLAEAAMGGLGLALVPLFLFQNELQSGRLVLAVEASFESPRSYCLTHQAGMERDYKVRTFKRWLFAQSQQSAQLESALR